eukprot:8227789-Alexandrium_andersonii.AAC.1
MRIGTRRRPSSSSGDRRPAGAASSTRHCRWVATRSGSRWTAAWSCGSPSRSGPHPAAHHDREAQLAHP